jgi:Dna[CI] antecedent, DciA
VSSKSTRDKPASLGSLLATSREAAARLAGTAIDREQWRRVVGERIAARTEPGPKRGRELTVFVASASWAQELSLLVNEIVVRLKAAHVHVDTVRFRVREIAPPLRDPAAPKPASRKAALPAKLVAHLAEIEDLELRDAVAEAAALWLAREEAPTHPGSATSTRPAARSPRAAESRSARSDRTPSSGRARAKGKP